MANEVRMIDPKEFLDLFYVASAGQDKAFVKTVEMCLEDTPTVDAVEVVRCKECKQWGRNGGIAESPNGHCFCHDIETNGHDFCSYGERRNDV
jgi:hypothetical protein